MPVTIKQIAKIAQVSRGTVDKVLHNRPGLSDAVRDRVMQVINELQYQPNQLAKSLSQSAIKRTLGVIVIAPDGSPFAQQIKNGIEAIKNEMRDFGFEILLHEMREFDAEEQAEIIRRLIDDKVDGIAVMALQSASITEAVKCANGHSIPVVSFVSDLEGCERLCFVGQDLPKGARIAAELLAKAVGKRGGIAILHGPRNMNAHVQRIECFKQVLARDYPDIAIMECLETRDLDELSYRQAKKVLSDPELAGIYLTGAGIGGVAKALCESNRRDVSLVCFDLTPVSIEYLHRGIIDFIIEQDAFEEGYLSVKVLAEYLLSKEQPEKDKIYTNCSICIKENT